MPITLKIETMEQRTSNKNLQAIKIGIIIYQLLLKKYSKTLETATDPSMLRKRVAIRKERLGNFQAGRLYFRDCRRVFPA